MGCLYGTIVVSPDYLWSQIERMKVVIVEIVVAAIFFLS